MRRLALLLGVLALVAGTSVQAAAAQPDVAALPSDHVSRVSMYGTLFGLTLEREVPTGDLVDLRWGWAALTDDEVQQWLDGTTNTFTLDGREYPVTLESRGDFVVFLHVLMHPLAPGSYDAVVTTTFDRDVFDGIAVTPAGTVLRCERVVVVTPRRIYPQFDYSPR